MSDCNFCIECNMKVRALQHAVTCDICFRWQHRLCNQVHKLLDDILSQWDNYHSELDVVIQTLSDTENCLQRINTIGRDIAAITKQVDELEHLKADMKILDVSRFEKFSKLAIRLSQVCEAPARQEIEKTQSEIHKRWKKVFGELQTRTKEIQGCLQQWLAYEEEYKSTMSWLGEKEKLCDKMLYDTELRLNHVANLANCKALQQDLDLFESRLGKLCKVGDNIIKIMDPSSIVNITSKLSGMRQRVLSLRYMLGRHIQSLQEEISQQKRFHDAFDKVEEFVSQAQKIHGKEDPNKSANETVLADRLEQLKKLADQFSDKSSQLGSLNDLGYRLSLNETSAVKLKKLNHSWHDLHAETKERCKILQGVLLVQDWQDFTSKCETWMTFLAKIESDLSTKIAVYSTDLLSQQQKCKKIEWCLKDFKGKLQDQEKSKNILICQCRALTKVSNEVMSSDIEQKIARLGDTWEHVKTDIGSRQRKLEETSMEVQLNLRMSNNDKTLADILNEEGNTAQTTNT